MTQQIHKYDLSFKDTQRVMMPRGAVVLSVQNQYGNLTLWARVDTQEEHVEHGFLVLCTGQPMPEPEELGRFVGTVQFHGGGFIVHVFDLGEVP
jgi:hypothetical protein